MMFKFIESKKNVPQRDENYWTWKERNSGETN